MKNAEEKIWAYLDGTLDETEKSAIERMAANDPLFRRELLERQRLHLSLKEVAPESPSMRFSLNIMDQLPALYRKISEQPLIPAFLIRGFWGLLGSSVVFFTWIISSAGNHAATGSRWLDPAIGSALDKYLTIFDALPQQTLVIIAAVSSACLLLLLIDQKMAKRVSRQEDR